MGSVEPLAVLPAKLDEQMMGDKRLLLPFSAQTASKWDHWICMHLQAQGTGPCAKLPE